MHAGRIVHPWEPETLTGYYILTVLLPSFSPTVLCHCLGVYSRQYPSRAAARFMILADLSRCGMNDHVTHEQRHIGLDF